MVILSLNSDWWLKKLQILASHFLWSMHTNVLLKRFLNRAKCTHKSTCKKNSLFKVSGLTQKQFQTVFKGQPMVTDSLKAFNSTAAPLDGTLGSINTWPSSMSNPNFLMLVRYTEIERVACALTILWKVYNKSFKNSWIEVWYRHMNEWSPSNLQSIIHESRTDILVF